MPLYISQKEYVSQWRKINGYEFYQKMSEVSYAYDKLKLAQSKCLPALLDQLTDPTDAIRAMVAEILSYIGDVSAIETLENALSGETNARNKKIMAISLDILRGVDVSETMRKQASYHARPDDYFVKKQSDNLLNGVPMWLVFLLIGLVVLIAFAIISLI